MHLVAERSSSVCGQNPVKHPEDDLRSIGQIFAQIDTLLGKFELNMKESFVEVTPCSQSGFTFSSQYLSQQEDDGIIVPDHLH